MLELAFEMRGGSAPMLLFIGAHSDDIEIGCGGTVIELLRRYPEAKVGWLVLSTGDKREREARLAANSMLRRVRDPQVTIKDFRGSYFPSEAAAIKDFLEEYRTTVEPDIIFCHFRDDLHQDHRIVAELCWNTWRNHVILEYEIPKFDGGLGSPSLFVPLRRSTVKSKVDLLMRTFKTQLSKPWFTPDTFEGLMRLRGIECNSPSGFAEAFYSRKLVLG